MGTFGPLYGPPSGLVFRCVHKSSSRRRLWGALSVVAGGETHTHGTSTGVRRGGLTWTLCATPSCRIDSGVEGLVRPSSSGNIHLQ